MDESRVSPGTNFVSTGKDETKRFEPFSKRSMELMDSEDEWNKFGGCLWDILIFISWEDLGKNNKMFENIILGET